MSWYCLHHASSRPDGLYQATTMSWVYVIFAVHDLHFLFFCFNPGRKKSGNRKSLYCELHFMESLSVWAFSLLSDQ